MKKRVRWPKQMIKGNFQKKYFKFLEKILLFNGNSPFSMWKWGKRLSWRRSMKVSANGPHHHFLTILPEFQDQDCHNCHYRQRWKTKRESVSKWSKPPFLPLGNHTWVGRSWTYFQTGFPLDNIAWLWRSGLSCLTILPELENWFTVSDHLGHSKPFPRSG